MNIYIGNLPKSATEDDVRKLFSSYGQVDRISLLTDRDSGELRGYGFVQMPVRSEAIEAIDLVNGSDLDGKRVSVNEANGGRDRDDRSYRSSRSSSYRY
jgi:RNA recognition motif-containing protein